MATEQDKTYTGKSDLQPRIDIESELDDLDRFLIKKKIENPAISNIELAALVGKNRNTVAQRLLKVKVRAAIDEFSKSAMDVLIASQTEAARRLVQLMRSEDPDVSLRACLGMLKDVLSTPLSLRSPKSEVLRFLGNLTEEDINAFKKK